MSKEQHQEDVKPQEKIATLRTIVVYNDDVNTFDHVIKCFTTILKMNETTAIMSAYTIDQEGKCDVRTGSYNELEPFALALLNQQLSAKIE